MFVLLLEHVLKKVDFEWSFFKTFLDWIITHVNNLIYNLMIYIIT